MKRDIRSFVKGTDAQKTVESYSAKSNDELMSELDSLKESGVVNNQELIRMARTISPMLNKEQKQRLDELVSRLMD